MKAKQLNDIGDTTWAVILDHDERVIESLTAFAKQKKLSAARITGIGAFRHATLGFFERERKDYHKIEIMEQTEVLCLIGDITVYQDEPRLHLHVVLGKKDGSAHGGHLLEAVVWPTLEIIVTESPSHLVRRYDEETKLPLIDLAET